MNKVRSLQHTLAIVFLLTSLNGCGRDGPVRQVITGNVTWKGQPIPTGALLFDPDVSKGNQGPQGFTLITDGKYDTRSANSKGCVAGPHIVTISGYDGKDIRQFHRYGDPLFAPHKMEIDIPAEGGQIDLVVPDSAARAQITAELD
jgi:hypothetical protein